MSGWIKIHRDIISHWVFSDSDCFKRWIDLVMVANFEESKILISGCLVNINRGQLAWSQDALSKRWKCTRQNVRTFLNNLEKDGMILKDFVQKSNHKVMIITICNYSKYQDSDNLNQPLANQKPTTSQPLANHIIRIKEEKEVKKESVRKNKPTKTLISDNFFISENVLRWYKENGFEESIKYHFDIFIDKCKQSGYMYVNWDSAFKTAIRDDWAKARVKTNNFDNQVSHIKKPLLDPNREGYLNGRKLITPETIGIYDIHNRTKTTEYEGIAENRIL